MNPFAHFEEQFGHLKLSDNDAALHVFLAGWNSAMMEMMQRVNKMPFQNDTRASFAVYFQSQMVNVDAIENPKEQESTCNKTLIAQGKAYPRTCKKCGFGPCIADRVQPQRKPLTDKMVLIAARVMSDRQADACNVNKEDQWKVYGQDFIDDARAMLEAAHNIKEST
jgi:hypothetical protein